VADQGAEVIRVDPPGGHRWRHPANAVLQRGKRSIVLDLKHSNDLAIARDLVASADGVIENFRPGVMERLGLGLVSLDQDSRGRRTGCSRDSNPYRPSSDRASDPV
jgi:crotonobetainyl-CoA:carnitine CoA-transferase CaiB-like acyl-CoA transferase